MFDLAVCAEMVFLDLPMVERIEQIRDRGFAVEIWSHGAHDIDALVGTGATFSSMTGYVAGGLTDEAGGEDYVRTAQECIEVAERLGCPRLNLHGTGLDDRGLPVTPVTHVTGPMWLAAARTLERLGRLGERHGVTFMLENLNTAVDHPGVPFARAADTLALIEAVDHRHVRVNLDLYHAQIGEGNLIDLVRRARPVIGEVQVADVPGRCEPGTGEINYLAIRDVLVEEDYDGTVGLEGWASGDPVVALDRFHTAFTPASEDTEEAP